MLVAGLRCLPRSEQVRSAHPLAGQPPTRQGPDTVDSSKQEVRVRLTLDWKALGINPAKAKLTAPSLAFFQNRAEFSPEEEIPIEPGKGWLLVLEEG